MSDAAMTTASVLTGVTILELGQAYMAPYCTLLMQRLGADVIKIEPPGGELYRRPTARKRTEWPQFAMMNAGKRSLRLDLKKPAGQALFRDLAATADVIVQNYAPGTFDRLVGIDSLRAANPGLIIASGSGYGSSGPYSPLRAMDLAIQAMSGVMSTTGFEDSAPVRTGPSVVDFMGGAHLFGAVMAALIQRSQTGQGQRVEVALYDAVLPSLASNIAGYLDSDGTIPERTGNRHGGLAVAPYNAYPAADGWVALQCLHEGHWATLCAIMGRPELAAQPPLNSNAGRVADMARVDQIVGEWTASRPREAITTRLTTAGIPCAPVQTLAEVINDPQVRARRMLERHQGAEGHWWTMGSPIRLADSPARQDNLPFRLGQHGAEILKEKLSLDIDRIAALEADEVI